MKSDSGLWPAYLCFFGLPLLAIGFISFCAYQVAVSTSASPWIVVPVGVVLGTLFLGSTIVSSGTDMMDFAVSSIIVIVLTLILVPTLMRARDNAHRKAIKQALREHGAIYPQPKRKEAQRRRWASF